ncbi:MAG: flagellar protein FlaG [Thermodesulfobacteriota bacterium]
MVDVSMNTEMKVYGAPVVPTTTAEDRVKPQVAPVKESSDGENARLDDRALHGRNQQGAGGKKTLNREDAARLVQEIQQRLDSIGGNLQLGINQDKKSESIVVKVTERKTGTVIRQVPSEELLQLKQKLEDLVGLLFDQKA